MSDGEESEQDRLRRCQVTLRFRCYKRWDDLKQTTEGDVRHCDTCNLAVRHVQTREQLIAARSADQCVMASFDDAEEPAGTFVGQMEVLDWPEPPPNS